MKPFEIFKAGSHTSSQGDQLAFGDDDVAAIAAGYDPLNHQAPIVVGHPKSDAPAYGWVEKLAIQDGALVASPAQVDTAFADLIKQGRFKKVSAAFYTPSSKNNPTPGSYYLRHVGFLGAQAPAVKGLKGVEFSADDPDVAIVEVSFGDTDNMMRRASWALDAAHRLFRGLRDRMIEASSIEEADKAMPDWELEQISRAAAEMRAEADDTKSHFNDLPAGDPTPKVEDDMTKTPEQIAAEEKKIADDKAALAADRAAFAEEKRKDVATADAAFVKSIVDDGRMPVGLQAAATALFSGLADEEVTFSDGDKDVSKSPRATFRDILSAMPVMVSTGEIAKGEAADFSDPVAFAEAIAVEISEAEKSGKKLTPADAAARVQAKVSQG